MFPLPVSSKKGMYLFQLPEINVSWTKFLLQSYHLNRGPSSIIKLQKAQFPCFICIIITKKSDLYQNPEKFSNREFSFIAKYQMKAVRNHYNALNPTTNENLVMVNPRKLLIIRVQVKFNRLLAYDKSNYIDFEGFFTLIVDKGSHTWYRMSRYASNKAHLMDYRQEVVKIIGNHDKFSSLLETPTDLYVVTSRSSYLDLNGFYDRKESCAAYSAGPFYVVREVRYRPSAAIFFTLICLGNYTFGKANQPVGNFRNERGEGRNTYFEIIEADMNPDMALSAIAYFKTMSKKYSFMTCNSRESLSFLIFAKAFDVEVWIVFLFTTVTIILALVLILITKLKSRCSKAISFAQLVVISIVFERPTAIPIKIERMVQFRIMLGFLLLLIQVLTNGYLGLSITSISAPLAAISVTRFHQLAKPGCDTGNRKCQLDRLKRYNTYMRMVDDHARIFYQRSLNTESYWVKAHEEYNRRTKLNRNRTLERLREQSIRKFDSNKDFVLLPYSLLDNKITKKVTINEFVYELRSYLDTAVNRILEKINLTSNVNYEVLVDTLALLDLLDPWHIPHPLIGNLSDMKFIKNEWDIEHALVQCGKTAVVLEDKEIQWGMRYFEKYYPWLRFFKSESAILPSESGWVVRYLGNSVSSKIIGRLYVAGIIQLLESWPIKVSQKRENITKKVHTLVERKPLEARVKKISLGGNIQMIFWIYFVLLIAGFGELFVFEIRIYRQIWKGMIALAGLVVVMCKYVVDTCWLLLMTIKYLILKLRSDWN